jgi:hypothetical protein
MRLFLAVTVEWGAGIAGAVIAYQFLPNSSGAIFGFAAAFVIGGIVARTWIIPKSDDDSKLRSTQF